MLLRGRIKGDALDCAMIALQCAPYPDPGRHARRCSRPAATSWHRRRVRAYVESPPRVNRLDVNSSTTVPNINGTSRTADGG